MTGLDDKHLVVRKHLGEPVGKDLAHLDVELVHLQFLLIALKPRILEAAGILSHLQLMHASIQQCRSTQNRKQNRKKKTV